MTTDTHFDGGRLRPGTVAHRHVVEYPDGQVSAVVVRKVPALVCERCDDCYYAPEVTDRPVAVMAATAAAPGQAIAVEYLWGPSGVRPG